MLVRVSSKLIRAMLKNYLFKSLIRGREIGASNGSYIKTFVDVNKNL